MPTITLHAHTQTQAITQASSLKPRFRVSIGKQPATKAVVALNNFMARVGTNRNNNHEITHFKCDQIIELNFNLVQFGVSFGLIYAGPKIGAHFENSWKFLEKILFQRKSQVVNASKAEKLEYIRVDTFRKSLNLHLIQKSVDNLFILTQTSFINESNASTSQTVRKTSRFERSINEVCVKIGFKC